MGRIERLAHKELVYSQPPGPPSLTCILLIGTPNGNRNRAIRLKV